jgi:hypothetical protein
MRKHILLAVTFAALWLVAGAAAHPHQAEPAEVSPVHDADDAPVPGDANNTGQYLANGDTHAGFAVGADGVIRSCETAPGSDPGQPAHPSGYGLETAHHGSDAEPGKGDGCYTPQSQTIPPADENPAIG